MPNTPSPTDETYRPSQAALDKAARVAPHVPRLLDLLRANTTELDHFQRAGKVDDNAPSRRRVFEAFALLDRVEGRA